MKETLNSVEAERKLLSAMMLKNGIIIPDIAEMITADDFFRVEHKIIFNAMLKAYEKGSFNLLLLQEELTHEGLYERVGHRRLMSLIDYECTTVRAKTYAELILDKSKRRKLSSIGRAIIEEAQDETLEISEVLNRADTNLQSALAHRSSENMEDISDVLEMTFKEMCYRSENRGELVGTPTGLIRLDRMTGGLKKSDLIILAARPSMGKTALALNMAIAASAKVPVVIFSLEMSKMQLGQRLLSLESKVDVGNIQRGDLTESEREAVTNALSKLADRPVKIDDTGGITLSELRMRAKQLKRKDGLGLVVVDYVQLMAGNKENRVQEVSEISRGLKALAKELDVPVLALSQLNRNLEMRADKRPLLADLRESGSLEQDADIVMFLYRDEYYNQDSESKGVAELIVAKNRNGETGMTALSFRPERMFFGDLTRAVE